MEADHVRPSVEYPILLLSLPPATHKLPFQAISLTLLSIIKLPFVVALQVIPSVDITKGSGEEPPATQMLPLYATASPLVAKKLFPFVEALQVIPSVE